MNVMARAGQPIIHCTPPTDPAFLASVSSAYWEAADMLSSDAAVLVGTLIRIRLRYPTASIIPFPRAGLGEPFSVWLVSREGWAEIEAAPLQAGDAPAPR
jgi:hypothetical protein